jgi:hypothetical protein
MIFDNPIGLRLAYVIDLLLTIFTQRRHSKRTWFKLQESYNNHQRESESWRLGVF